MTLNPIQLLPHLLRRQIRIKQMALLMRPPRPEVIIILKGLDIIIRIRAEQHPICLRVNARLARPGLPDRVAQRIRHELVVPVLEDLVETDVWGSRVRVARRVVVLCWEEAEVFAPELAAESCRQAGGAIGVAIHSAVKEVLVFHDDGDFAVVGAKLGLQELSQHNREQTRV